MGPFPDYSLSTTTNVTLRLMSAEKNMKFVRMLVEEQNRLDIEFSVDTLIVLSALRDEHRLSIEQFSRRMQKGESDARRTVEQLIENGIVEAIGKGESREYIFSKKVYSIAGNPGGYSKQKGLTIKEEKNLILWYLQNNPSISKKEMLELCKCADSHAKYVFSKMVEEGVLIKDGKGTATNYRLA